MARIIAFIFILLVLGTCILKAQRIEAENYSSMKGVQPETCSEGGKNVAYIDKDDWMTYTITPGTYRMSFRISCFNTTAQFQVRQSNDAVLLTVPLNKTGSYQDWKTVSPTTQFTVYQNTIKIYANTPGWNINWFELIPVNRPPGVNAGKDTSVTIKMADKMNMSLSGGATDPENDPMTYKWEIISGPISTLTNQGSLTATLENVTAGVYNMRLTVSDNKGNTATDDVVITVRTMDFKEVYSFKSGEVFYYVYKNEDGTFFHGKRFENSSVIVF
jgi:hypothetical protein